MEEEVEEEEATRALAWHGAPTWGGGGAASAAPPPRVAPYLGMPALAASPDTGPLIPSKLPGNVLALVEQHLVRGLDKYANVRNKKHWMPKAKTVAFSTRQLVLLSCFPTLPLRACTPRTSCPRLAHARLAHAHSLRASPLRSPCRYLFNKIRADVAASGPRRFAEDAKEDAKLRLVAREWDAKRGAKSLTAFINGLKAVDPNIKKRKTRKAASAASAASGKAPPKAPRAKKAPSILFL